MQDHRGDREPDDRIGDRQSCPYHGGAEDDTGTDETAETVASRIEEAVSEPYQVGPAAVRVGASVGIARGAPGEVAADVIARADVAMYEAKKARKPQ